MADLEGQLPNRPSGLLSPYGVAVMASPRGFEPLRSQHGKASLCVLLCCYEGIANGNSVPPSAPKGSQKPVPDKSSGKYIGQATTFFQEKHVLAASSRAVRSLRQASLRHTYTWLRRFVRNSATRRWIESTAA